MTKRSSTKVFTPFANPERQFRTKRDTTPIDVHNIYSFYESESYESESEEVGEINIEILTLEEYLALDRNDNIRRIKRPKIENNIEFEIKGQFLRELRNKTFSGNETEDAIEHIGRVLEIANLFNMLGVSRDDIMLWVFPLTLVRIAKRWLGRTSSETITTWDELKQVFIRMFCPPFVTFKRLGEIHNFGQEGGESLYWAWMQQFIKNTNKNLERHDLSIKNLEEKVVCLAHALAVQKVTPVESGIPTHDRSNHVRPECVMKLEPPRKTPIHKEQLLEPALNLTVRCCGREFRVLNGYDQKSFDEDRGLNCVVQTRLTLCAEVGSDSVGDPDSFCCHHQIKFFEALFSEVVIMTQCRMRLYLDELGNHVMSKGQWSHVIVQHSGQPLFIIDSGCSVCCCPVADTLSLAVICTSSLAFIYMGLISASASCASFPDLLLVSCSFDFVLLLQ
ncbi:hypothetical protein Tco_1564158 [Tanacetum coccineum]